MIKTQGVADRKSYLFVFLEENKIELNKMMKDGQNFYVIIQSIQDRIQLEIQGRPISITI